MATNKLYLSELLNNKIIFETGKSVVNYLSVLNSYKKRKLHTTAHASTHASDQCEEDNFYHNMQHYLVEQSTIKLLLNTTWIKWCPDTYPLKKLLLSKKHSSNVSRILSIINVFNDLQTKLIALDSELSINSTSIPTSITYSTATTDIITTPSNSTDIATNYNILKDEKPLQFFTMLDTKYSKALNIFVTLSEGFQIANIQYSPFVLQMLLLYTINNSNVMFSSLKDLLVVDEKIEQFKLLNWTYRIIPICTVPCDMGYFKLVGWDVDNGSYYYFILGGSDWSEALYNRKLMWTFLTKNQSSSNKLVKSKKQLNSSNDSVVINNIKKMKKNDGAFNHYDNMSNVNI